MSLLKNARPVWTEINLDNLIHNLNEIKKTTSDKAEIMAVVKANAYGHGAVEVSRTLIEEGVTRLAVANLTEAIELRQAGIDKEILILGYTPKSQFKTLIEYNITQTIYDYEAALDLSREASLLEKQAKLHIKIDTGMNRLGFKTEEHTVDEIVSISCLPNIYLEGIFSHFAKADETDKTFAETQYNEFISLIEKLKQKDLNVDIIHISNSAAIIDLPKYNLNLVRAGISLYGLYPSSEVRREHVKLKPVMTLKTQVSNMKRVPKGTGVSYGQVFTTKRESVIATIPIGYADGFSRMLSGNSLVTVSGKKLNVIGKICMDQSMVDATDVSDIYIDKEVIVFGEGENVNSAEDLAKDLGTISYEVVCMVSRRVPRAYKKNDKVVNIVDYLVDM